MTERESFDSAMDRFRGNFAEFQRESDRGCAVLVMCVLEDTLHDLFRARVVAGADIRALAPPGNMRVALSNAFAIGLLNEDQFVLFRELVAIRNLFAHRALENLGFDAPRVLSLMDSLTLRSTPTDWGQLLEGMRPREKFLMAASILQVSMLFALDHCTQLSALATE